MAGSLFTPPKMFNFHQIVSPVELTYRGIGSRDEDGRNQHMVIPN